MDSTSSNIFKVLWTSILSFCVGSEPCTLSSSICFRTGFKSGNRSSMQYFELQRVSFYNTAESGVSLRILAEGILKLNCFISSWILGISNRCLLIFWTYKLNRWIGHPRKEGPIRNNITLFVLQLLATTETTLDIIVPNTETTKIQNL